MDWNVGEIVEIDNSQYITGTVPGHYYDIIRSGKLVSIGKRPIKSEPGHTRIRVQMHTNREFKGLDGILEEFGFENHKRDNEEYYHYSKVIGNDKVDEMVKLVIQAVESCGLLKSE